MIFGNPFLGRGWIEEYYTSSRSWVAPPGVNNLISLEIRGGTGTNSGYAWEGVVIAVRRIFSNYQYPISKSTLNSQAVTEYNKFPSTSGEGEKTVTWNNSIYSSGSEAPTTNLNTTGVYRVAPGYVKTQVGAGGFAPGWGTSGTWNPGDAPLYWGIGNIQQRFTSPATTGGDTKAFGLSANGGAAGGGLGQTLSAANVPIVPGQSYSLTIPSGGYVRIIY